MTNNNLRIYSGLLMVLVLFSGPLACEEKKEPLNEVPPNTPITPTSTLSSDTNTSQDTTSFSNTRSILVTVDSITNTTYVVKNADGESSTIQATASTLVDEGLMVGDKVEVRYSEDNQPIAIRKVREGLSPIENRDESSAQNGILHGTLSRIDQERSLYVVKPKTGEERNLTTNSNTLIDESAQVGDEVEVKISADNEDQAIAIRKKRDSE